MTAAWPFPGLPLVGAQIAPGNTMERTEVEGGPPVQRRRFTAAIDVISGTVILKGVDLATFRAWGQTTLAGWTLPFNWLALDAELEATYRFVAPPTINGIVGHHETSERAWEVSMVLEQLPA